MHGNNLINYSLKNNKMKEINKRKKKFMMTIGAEVIEKIEYPIPK